MRAALMVCLVLGAPSPADAQDTPRVVVTGGDPAIVRGLGAELGLLGFEALNLPALDDPDPARLETLARAHEAVAVVALHDVEAGLQVTVVDRITEKRVVRVIELAADPRVTMLRALEVLRASFLEVDARRFEPTEAALPVPAAVRALAEESIVRPPPDRRLAMARLGAALSLDPGGMAPGAHIDLDVAFRLGLGLGAHAWTTLPTAPLVAQAPEGRAEQVLVLAGVGLAYWPLPATHSVDVRIALGAGALWMRSAGEAAPGFVSTTDETVTVVVRAESSVGWWFSESFGIYGAASALLALPRVVVLFDDRPVASWGQPAIVLTLGLQGAVP